MKWWCVALAALVVGCAQSAHAQRETCHAMNPNPYIEFATMTAYEYVNEKFDTQQHIVPNCEPVLFWSLNRHGAQLPNASSNLDLQTLEKFKQSVLRNYDNATLSWKNRASRKHRVPICLQDINNLRQWHWNPNHHKKYAGGDLSVPGYMNTQGIARMWRDRFPRIMTNDPNDYLFKYVEVEDRLSRNSFQASFHAYTEGVFGQRATTLQIPKETDDEFSLQPFKHCATWSHDVEHNKDTMTQVKNFTSNKEFKTMMMDISSRLGYSYQINISDVERMWEMCRLNKALDLYMSSPWCAAFTRDDLRRLEYIEDLKSYYRSSYGSPLSAKLGCAPIKDMVQFFSKYVNSPFPPHQPKAVISFVQSAMLLMTLNAMGAYHDTVPLTGYNFHTRLMEYRKWRTSDIVPLNANLVAVLYRCRDNRQQFRVLFLLNERPIYLNGCSWSGLCDWSWVKKKYGHVADKCDVKKFCTNGSDVNSIGGLLLVLAFFVAIGVY